MAKVLTLQDRINKIGEYFSGIDKYNEALIVKVVFPSGWQTFPTELIKVVQSENIQGEWFYYGNSNQCTLDDIFDLVEVTIQSNQDMLKKVELLKAKIDELKEEFSKRDLKDLMQMKFVFPKEKVKRPKKEKKDENIQIIPSNIKEENKGTEEEVKEEVVQ